MNNEGQGVPKTHPLTREMLAEDPLLLHGFEVPGDTELMFRVVVEELARMSWDANAIVAHARNPHFQALFGLWQLHGEVEFRRKVGTVLSRVGVTRVRETVAPMPAELVQLAFPGSS